MVHLGFDNVMKVYYQGHCLKTRPAPVETTIFRSMDLKPAGGDTTPPKIPMAHLPAKPSPDHPWRGKFRVHFD